MYVFRILVKDNEKLVAHMIGRLIHDEDDRADVSQEVFMKVYEKLSEFKFNCKLSTWIATIAYRLSINYLRKKKVYFELDVADRKNQKDFLVSETPEGLMEEKDLQQFVRDQINLLPPQYRILITLYHLEGMSYEEIGQITGMPEGTVKNYLFRARSLLKEKLQKQMLKTEEFL